MELYQEQILREDYRLSGKLVYHVRSKHGSYVTLIHNSLWLIREGYVISVGVYGSSEREEFGLSRRVHGMPYGVWFIKSTVNLFILECMIVKFVPIFYHFRGSVMNSKSEIK